MLRELTYDEMFQQYLKKNLRLEVKTQSNYTGGMNEGPLYVDSHTVQLVLEDEIISEVNLW